VASEIRLERMHNGVLRAWVCPDTSRVVFRQCADFVVDRLGAEARDRFDGGDQLFWDFVAAELPFTLHLEREQGVSVLAGDQSSACESLVRQIAQSLSDEVERVTAR